MDGCIETTTNNPMSLYHEAASIIDTSQKNGGSLKSLVFGRKTWKTDAKTLFALTIEAAKWSEILSEVVEKSGILILEKQLSPTLVLVLAHDLLLAKKGIALPQKHGLNAAISKHRARLSAELTKARLRRGFATVENLRANVNGQAIVGAEANCRSDGAKAVSPFPRWIRINTLRTSLAEQLETTFKEYVQVDEVKIVTHHSSGRALPLHIDTHIPNLIAIPAGINITSSSAYKDGKLILQDKASCFPAYLLDPTQYDGDIIDTCAAPGNKTTHLAAIIHEGHGKGERKRQVFACEQDPLRSETLEKMTKIAGAEKIISIKASQDSIKLKPHSQEFAHVSTLLLDPSCSGSGIVGRDEGSVTVRLPKLAASEDTRLPKGKKRKRGGNNNASKPAVPPPVEAEVEEAGDEAVEETPTGETDEEKLKARLAALSTFQLRILQHAMSFPAARRIAYSTCSIYPEENEHVVMKALQSSVGAGKGWRILKRKEQVYGMRKWQKRGMVMACRETGAGDEAQEISEGCIRCEKGSEEGTMGFFVAAFVRDDGVSGAAREVVGGQNGDGDQKEEEEDEWEGFD